MDDLLPNTLKPLDLIPEAGQKNACVHKRAQETNREEKKRWAKEDKESCELA